MSLKFPISLIGKRVVSITDPTEIAGLDLWLDASDNSTVLDATDAEASDNEAVKTWQDKSSNANHAVAPTESKYPLRRAAEVNGLDTLDFDGLNDTMTGTFDLTPRQTDDKTVFVVLAADVVGVIDCIFNLYDNLHSSVGGSGFFTTEIAYRCFTNIWISSTTPSTSAASLISMTQAPTGNLFAAVSMWLDGSSVTRTSGTDGAFLDRSAKYLLGFTGSGAAYYNGDICEVIVYDRELSTADRQAVETYLANKWGITLP